MYKIIIYLLFLQESCYSYNNSKKLKIDQYPWIISIATEIEENGVIQNKIICEGSLVHSKMILTAASCIANYKIEKLKIASGRFITRNDYWRYFLDTSIRRVINHNSYNETNIKYDIALLALSKSVDLAKTSLLYQKNSPKHLYMDNCYFASAGLRITSDSNLLKYELNIENGYNCINSLTSINESHDHFICANQRTIFNTCGIANGSPLMCKYKKKFIQVGLMTNNNQNNCQKSDMPAIFTYLPYYYNWIQAEIKYNKKYSKYY